jgi:hypothetical protein
MLPQFCKALLDYLPGHEEKIRCLESHFDELARMGSDVYDITSYKIYVGTSSILGINAREYQLCFSLISNICYGNYNGSYASLRGMIENVATLAWILKSPERCVSLSKAKVSIGRITNAAFRDDTKLKSLYDESSNIVHPRQPSFLLSPTVAADGHCYFTALALGFSRHFCEELVEGGTYVVSRYNQLAARVREISQYLVVGDLLAEADKVVENFSC